MTALLEQIIEQQTLLAQQKHTPSSAMRTVAKRGLRIAQKHNDMDPNAVAVGRKIASGSTLSNQHVEHMAAYHSAHDGSCAAGTDAGSCEDMLWGGSPGAQWSSARVAAMDVSDLAQHDSPTILQLDQEGKGVSLEVFVRDALGEPTELDEEKSLIWAPILRSGMLATRPGPNGEKKHDPLVFVPGLAQDPRKEIGLQNLYDSYKAGAIQHVTIPTSHENGVLDNTGFIKDLKIVDSKRRPGEKVLVAAHDFRDPDVLKKVRLGTIANRSCGIVYDYVNTETGTKYEQVIDHVALTNRPWVTGMTPYGEIESEDDFSAREVIPMLLSEGPRETKLADGSSPFNGDESRYSDQQWAKSCVLDLGAGDAKSRYGLPIREPDGTLNPAAVKVATEKVKTVKGANLSQKKFAARSLLAAHAKIGEAPPEHLTSLVSASTNLSQAERQALLLADVQWGADQLSMNDITSQVVACLDEMRSPEEYYPNFSVMDVVGNPDPKALVRCDYGDPDGVNDAWVIPLEVDGDKVSLSDFASWTPVQKEWVTDEDAAQDKTEVASLLPGGLSESLNLGTLTAKERDALPATDFVFPSSREYPIHDRAHADDALARGAQNETGKRLATIKRKVAARYPALKSSPKTTLSATPLKGGAVKPTMTEQLGRLELSDEQRAVFEQMLATNQSLSTKLGEVTKQSRTDAVKARVKELQDAKFSPGFCRTYEEIALGDDGEVAAVLNLSDDKGNQNGQKEYTATEIADRLIAALPKDDSGALALAEQADLLTSPISGRPPLDAKDQKAVEDKNDPNRPKTGEEWLSDVAAIDLGLAGEIQRVFNFSSDSTTSTDTTKKGA